MTELNKAPIHYVIDDESLIVDGTELYGAIKLLLTKLGFSEGQFFPTWTHWCQSFTRLGVEITLGTDINGLYFFLASSEKCYIGTGSPLWFIRCILFQICKNVSWGEEGKSEPCSAFVSSEASEQEILGLVLELSERGKVRHLRYSVNTKDDLIWNSINIPTEEPQVCM